MHCEKVGYQEEVQSRYKYTSFWIRDLIKQRNKRYKAREMGEKNEGTEKCN